MFVMGQVSVFLSFMLSTLSLWHIHTPHQLLTYLWLLAKLHCDSKQSRSEPSVFYSHTGLCQMLRVDRSGVTLPCRVMGSCDESGTDGSSGCCLSTWASKVFLCLWSSGLSRSSGLMHKHFSKPLLFIPSAKTWLLVNISLNMTYIPCLQL